MTDPVVSTEYLAARLGAPDLSIVDATWYMPAENRSGRDEFFAARIPGAVFFDIDDIADKTVDLPHMLPAVDDFARAAGALGLTPEKEVVVYDAHGLFSAPRVWWTLRAMGFPRVHVLDGGLPRWLAEGKPTESGPADAAPVNCSARLDASMVRALDEMRAIVAARSAQIIDARPAARFRAEAPEPRAGLRSGHMPGASNIPWNAVVANGALKPANELRDAFTQAGIALDLPIVATCGSGVSAAVLALALARLGVDRIPIYDGSWTEWGGRQDTPIVTGP